MPVYPNGCGYGNGYGVGYNGLGYPNGLGVGCPNGVANAVAYGTSNVGLNGGGYLATGYGGSYYGAGARALGAAGVGAIALANGNVDAALAVASVSPFAPLNTLTLEAFALGSGWYYYGGKWYNPDITYEGYGDELVESAISTQLILPRFCGSYTLQMNVASVSSIIVRGTGNMYNPPPLSVNGNNDQYNYNVSRLNLGKTITLNNSSNNIITVNDYRNLAAFTGQTNPMIVNNIMSDYDSNPALPLLSFKWPPYTALTLKSVLTNDGNNQLAWLFESLTSVPLTIVQQPKSSALVAPILLGNPVPIVFGATAGAVSVAGPGGLYFNDIASTTGVCTSPGGLIPIPTTGNQISKWLGSVSNSAPVSSSTLGPSGGVTMILDGQCLNPLQNIAWFTVTNGVATPIPVGTTTFATATVFAAQVRINLLPGYITPPLGSTPFTNATTFAAPFVAVVPGAATTIFTVVERDAAAYTLQIQYAVTA